MIRRRRQDVLASLPPLQVVETSLDIRREHVDVMSALFGVCHLGNHVFTGVASARERVGLCKVHAAR